MNVCNQSSLRLPILQDHKLLTLCWLSFSGWGREHLCLGFDYNGSQWIQERRWHTNINILRLATRYLNVTMNSSPDIQNRRLHLMCQARHIKTQWLIVTGSVVARQEPAGQVPGWVCNRTDRFLRSEPTTLASYLDPLPTPDMTWYCLQNQSFSWCGFLGILLEYWYTSKP